MRETNRRWPDAAGMLLAILISGFPARGVGQVQVGRVDYHGWEDAVEIANSEVRLVVVPSIGRIMYYGFLDGGNVLWNDPEQYGKILPGEPFQNEEGRFVWTNFGGDKVWPNQQSEFERINGHSWPPDHWFDGGRHKAEIVENGVIITSPVSRYNGARSIRAIRLSPDGTRVEIDQRIEKVGPAARKELEPLRYTIWSVTQINPPEQTLYPLNPHSYLGRRFHPFGSGEVVLRNFSVRGDIGIFVPDPVASQKSGADSDRWLAAVVGDLVIAQFFRRDSTQRYPDGGLSAEVYTCPDYTELELLGPWVALETGESLRFPIAWELHRLSGLAEDTPEERRRAALEWLWTHPY